jgi:uncharacterized membrane protein YqaE (UPF0057 family)
MQDSTAKLILKIIVAFLLPPAAAFWQVRLSLHFWINIVLWLIAWLPGIAHAIWLILREKYQVLNVDVPRTGQQT